MADDASSNAAAFLGIRCRMVNEAQEFRWGAMAMATVMVSRLVPFGQPYAKRSLGPDGRR